MQRMAVWQYWLVTAALLGAGWFAVTSVAGTSAMAPVLAGVLIVALPIHVYTARLRLIDAGYDPDDAFLALIPLANLWVEFRCLFHAAPREELRQKRIAGWSKHLGALDALRAALPVWVRGLPVFLPLAVGIGVLYGGANLAAGAFIDWMSTAPAAEVDQTRTGLWIAAAMALAYAVLQTMKRHSATRASWIPALFALPLGFLALALQLRGSRDLGPAIVSLPFEGLDLLWTSFVGALAAVVVLVVGDRLKQGDSVGDAWSAAAQAVRAKGGDVIAVHGGAATAIFAGLQVVIPGIHYLVAYAFTDMVVIFHGEKPAFSFSAELAHGIRRRLFVAQFLGFLLYLVPSLIITGIVSDFDPQAFVNGMLDPRSVSLPETIVGGALWALAVALINLVVLEVYRSRVEALRKPVAVGAPLPADVANPFAPGASG